MVKSISFKNYKAFKNKAKFEIKPLTILVGPNSAGKTSITDLLLLLSQTVDSNLVGQSINYNGEKIDLVDYKRVLNSNCNEKKCN